ncbi:MAG: hypothetical protein J5802_02890 [Butyrivibrio sp.]|nr:hypothetical protein [Butyrivibrio sp.]
MSEIEDLKHEISECEEEISELDTESENIRRLQSELRDGAEEPEKNYDMTAGDEFRGVLQNKAEDLRLSTYYEISSFQNLVSQFLEEAEQAKANIRDHIKDLERRIEELEAELAAQASRQDVM